MGALIPNSYEVWKDDRQRDSEFLSSIHWMCPLLKHPLPSPLRAGTPTRVTRMSPTLSGSQDGGGGTPGYDQQFIVVASEKQCRVMTLPSQNCIYKQQITDTDYVIKAEIINLKGEWVDVDLSQNYSFGHHEPNVLVAVRRCWGLALVSCGSESFLFISLLNGVFAARVNGLNGDGFCFWVDVEKPLMCLWIISSNRDSTEQRFGLLMSLDNLFGRSTS